MTLDALRALCATLPGTVEDVKWGADLCFCVGEKPGGGKIYAVTGLESTGLTVKTAGPGEAAAWCQRAGVSPAPYLARYHWIRLAEDAAVTTAEREALVREAYALVRAKLPKKVQRALPPLVG